MNPFSNVIDLLHGVIAHVPAVLHPVVVAVAGAIPFVDGELAGVLGVWAGLHPVLAGSAAAVGNFLVVLGIVLVGGRIRGAALARRARRGVAAADAPAGPGAGSGAGADASVRKPESAGRARFRRFVVRFGVPGASLLGPLALPGHFTSAILVGSGVSKSWILLWQAVSIVLWTAATTAVAAGALTLVTG